MEKYKLSTVTAFKHNDGEIKFTFTIESLNFNNKSVDELNHCISNFFVKNNHHSIRFKVEETPTTKKVKLLYIKNIKECKLIDLSVEISALGSLFKKHSLEFLEEKAAKVEFVFIIRKRRPNIILKSIPLEKIENIFFFKQVKSLK